VILVFTREKRVNLVFTRAKRVTLILNPKKIKKK